jgi:hypothetical protein
LTELVTVGGGLPRHLELQTGKVLDVLLRVFPTDKTRKQVNDWLYRNSKPGFNIWVKKLTFTLFMVTNGTATALLTGGNSITAHRVADLCEIAYSPKSRQF